MFGSKCYGTRGNQNKFDQKSDKEILMGYSRKSKAYKVLLKERQTMIESLHVNFDETINILDIVEEEENEALSEPQPKIPHEEREEEKEPKPQVGRNMRNSHSTKQVIGDKNTGVQTRSSIQGNSVLNCLVYQIEPKKVSEALD